jgi:hypothetical protein
LINQLDGLSSITTSAYFPLAEMQSLPHVVSGQHNGDFMHIQTDDVATTLRSMLELAQNRGVRLHDLHIKQPGLEDVFLKLTGYTIRG